MTAAYLPALGGDPTWGYEDRVHMLATWLVLRDTPDLAVDLTTSFEPDDWHGRRAYLLLTGAWDAAEELLDGGRPVRKA